MVKVNIIGLKELQDKIAKLPVTLKKEVGAEVQFAAEDFRTRAIKDAPADVGFLRGQITVKRTGEMSAEVVSGSKYSAPMEFGTKSKFQPIAGVSSEEFKGLPKGGTWLQFIDNIKKWTKRKGIPVSASYLIARSILKFGVKPHPFFFKQILPVKSDFIKRVKNILNDL